MNILFKNTPIEEKHLEKRNMEIPTAPTRFSPATLGRHPAPSINQSPGSPYGPMRLGHTPQALPFPSMRPGMLQAPPGIGQSLPGAMQQSNPALGLLNLLNKSPLLASLHYQQQQQKQAAHQAMSANHRPPVSLNGPSVMDIYQLVSMARDSLKPKEIVSSNKELNLKTHNFKEARGQMVNHYHQLAVIEQLKKQSAMITSQVILYDDYTIFYVRHQISVQ